MFEAVIKTSVIVFCLCVAACTENTPQEAKEKPEKKDLSHLLPKEDTTVTAPVRRWTTIVDRSDIRIQANSNLDESMIQAIKVKFEPYVWFEDFPAPIQDTTSKAPLDFSSNKAAREYRTVIRDGYKQDYRSFGGHYDLIAWGCGAPCANGVIVDRKTGKIYHLPESTMGYDCNANSLLLVVNPTWEEGFYNLLESYWPMLYVFDEDKKTFEMLKPKGR